LFLHAITLHRENWKQWKFLIVGDGPDKEAIMAMASAAQVSHLVDFLPWQQDLSTLYSAVDLIVLPSRFEGVPVVMLEAMYCRLGMVASNCDAMAELLPPDWLFPVGDVQGLAAALLRAQNRDDGAVLERNRLLIVERFTLGKQGVNFAKAVGELMDHFAGQGVSGSAISPRS
jgi:glycosyltransferase involved in cell wall biosynthesis